MDAVCSLVPVHIIFFYVRNTVESWEKAACGFLQIFSSRFFESWDADANTHDNYCTLSKQKQSDKLLCVNVARETALLHFENSQI